MDDDGKGDGGAAPAPTDVPRTDERQPGVGSRSPVDPADPADPAVRSAGAGASVPRSRPAKARPTDRVDRPTLLGDDRAVSHVVGFVLMFAIAFMVLTLALVLVSSQVQDKTRRDQRTSFVEAAATIASAVQEAVAFADLYPNSTFHRTVALPEGIASVPHELTVTHRSVYLNTTGAGPEVRVQAGGFDLAAEGIAFQRTVTGASRLDVTYLRLAGIKTLFLDGSP